MTKTKKYYHAYDERYKVIHEHNSTWATNIPTPMIEEILIKYDITKEAKILEIGCGEGRDSIQLLNQGYNLSATDVSNEAIRYCQEKYPMFKEHFGIVDACKDRLNEQYDFIFATSVLHMLTEDEDRNDFYQFIYHHLKIDGLALILTMGDGECEFCTDTNTAFELVEKNNNADGIPVLVTRLGCRMVNFETFDREINQQAFQIIEKGVTACPPDFPSLMYVLLKK